MSTFCTFEDYIMIAVRFQIIALVLSLQCICSSGLYAQPDGTVAFSITSGETSLSLREYGTNSYGVVLQLGQTVYEQKEPCQVEIVDESGVTGWYRLSYSDVKDLGNGKYEASATVSGANGSAFTFTDTYSLTTIDSAFEIDRVVKVTKTSAKDSGFSTMMALQQPENTSMTDYDFFAPGIWYLDNKDVADIALATDYNDNFYWFREDRMPLPVFMLRQKNNNVTFSVCHKDPKGDTFTGEDGLVRVIDGRMKFASLGMSNRNRPLVGIWYPGSEGERTGVYGNSSNRRWAHRSHPLTLNYEQQYRVAMRLTHELSFTDAMKNTWLAYYKLFNPAIYNCNLDQIYEDQIAMLSDYWKEINGAPGFPFYMDLEGNNPLYTYNLGFVGNQIANAALLIREGSRRNDYLMIAKGEQVVDWWANNSLTPSGCPKNWYDPDTQTWRNYETYSRVIADGFSGLLWAWNFKKQQGTDKLEWLETALKLGDWLLSNQADDGSFPRAWDWKTNTVVDASKTNTSHLIPLLVDLYKITRLERFRQAATAAGNYIYANEYELFKYIGGTPDNPNVPDREAASMALRAFLALNDLDVELQYKWLDAATQTAYYYETWVYCWDVPIPEDDVNATYPKNRSSTGLSLISTANNAADTYAAVDAFNFYRMYLYNGDPHFKEMARLLLYNTKQGLNWDRNDPIPGYGRFGIIEEAQTVMIPRGHGVGLHLPWQTFNLMEPLVLLDEVFEAYNIEAVDSLSTKHSLHNEYAITRGYVPAVISGINSQNAPLIAEVDIYPNPTSSVLNIASANNIAFTLIAICNSNGYKVLDLNKVDQNQIDISALPTGLYMLKIRVAGNLRYIKFLKQ